MDAMNPLDQPQPDAAAQPAEQIQNDEIVVDADAQKAALDKLITIGGPKMTNELDRLKAKLAAMKPPSEEKTISGAESPDAKPADGAPAAPAEPPRMLTGRDVDWSEYDLDYNVAHLYRTAVYREGPDGLPHWIAVITDFVSTEKRFKGYGEKSNKPGSNDKANTESQNLGEWLNDMCNGREQWKVEAVMPASSGQCGILLSRQVPLILPEPKQLQKTTEVAPPTDGELDNVEALGLDFMKENGLDTAAPVGDDSRGDAVVEPLAVGLTPIEAGTVEAEQAQAQLDEDGALPARRSTIISKALETAAPLTTAAPQGKGVQPEAVAGVDIARSNLNPDGKVASAGFAAAQDLLRALNDPNYRASLPTEEQ